MTSAEAIQHALDAAEPHETRDLHALAAEGGANVLKLRMVRHIGLAERSHETHATFSEGCDRDIFRQQCARAWAWLVEQHDKSRRETGI